MSSAATTAAESGESPEAPLDQKASPDQHVPEPSLQATADQMSVCSSCGLELPLRLKRFGERSKSWLCGGCRAPHEAVLEQGCPLEMIQRVHPVGIKFCKLDCRRATQAIAQFIRKCLETDADYVGPERRSSSRHRVAVPLAAIPLDAAFDAVGTPYMALTRDISNRGICLIGTRAVNSRYLALELCTPGTEQMQLVMRVHRCRPVHRFYEVGGPFVTRISEPLP